MYTLTKLAADGSDLPADATGHMAVRLDRHILGRPIIWTAHRSPKTLTWKQAQAWAAKLDIYGWSWRLPTVEEAFMLPDRSRAAYPAVDPAYFPDCEGDWIWADTEDAQPPSGHAWNVNLNNGHSGRGLVGLHTRVRAVRDERK
jgi:hypothetical protein